MMCDLKSGLSVLRSGGGVLFDWLIIIQYKSVIYEDTSAKTMHAVPPAFGLIQLIPWHKFSRPRANI